MNMVGQNVPWMMGGSCDLGSSCLTLLKNEQDFMPPSSGLGSYIGRNFNYGIREHAMGSIMNGMVLSKLRPSGSTFLVFSDYMKAPIRMAAMMEIPTTFIFTHDSIGVGEDGPTHQPVEHLVALRSIPGLLTFRPCDANETLEMWKYLMTCTREPTAVVLSRQAVPTLNRNKYASASAVSKGAYVIAKAGAQPDVILMATGSEVALMLEAHEILVAEGKKVWSVSMPCHELFLKQSQEYINSVLPDTCRARVSIEASMRHGWGTFIGLDGEHVGMSTFGLSGKDKHVQKALGFTVDAVMAAVGRAMDKQQPTPLALIREDPEDLVERAAKRQKVMDVGSFKETHQKEVHSSLALFA